ncbi:MAG TPA: trypsin-like peptidase domain-containing protein [Candidatus Acidoferrum sp.]|nr:trypsin-like peptidase domain-containing protein [Candidatus Acidoferrum sp.]
MDSIDDNDQPTLNAESTPNAEPAMTAESARNAEWATTAERATSAGPATAAGSAVEPRRTRRGSSGLGPLLGAALLSAVLGSAATFGLFSLAGAIPAASPAASATTGAVVQTVASNAPATDTGSVIENVAAAVTPAVVTITTNGVGRNASGVGSGVIVNANGWILTNNHVISGSGSITVALADGRTFDGTVAATDSAHDLAIVKVVATGLPTAALGDSTKLQVGQLVVAIGSPLGEYTSSVTSGIVSGLGRSITIERESLTDLIQTDAAINPGNSGGPLLDSAGKVIGIDTAEAGSAQGIGFAIPIETAKALIARTVAS